MQNKRILLTGATGFIGQHLSQTLESSFSLVKHGRKVNTLLSKDNYFQLDVNGRSDWKEHLLGVDVIIHLAASAHNKLNTEESIDEVNVNGALALAKQGVVAGVKRFIFISSIGVLGSKTKVPFDESTLESPCSDYANSKLKAEKALLALARKTSMEIVIIRPVLVYGDMAPSNFSKLKSLVKKVPFLPFGLVDNKRSFISVSNLASFIQLCIDHPNAKNEIFCISDGVDVSTKEFTNSIATGLSKKTFQLPIPNWTLRCVGRFFGKRKMVEQLIGNLQVDIGKAQSLLDWVPVETMDQAMDKLR